MVFLELFHFETEEEHLFKSQPSTSAVVLSKHL